MKKIQNVLLLSACIAMCSVANAADSDQFEGGGAPVDGDEAEVESAEGAIAEAGEAAATDADGDEPAADSDGDGEEE